jgi:hypothetical protein
VPVQIEQLDVVPRPQQNDAQSRPPDTQQQGQSTEQAPHQLDGDVERAIALLRSRELRLRAM